MEGGEKEGWNFWSGCSFWVKDWVHNLSPPWGLFYIFPSLLQSSGVRTQAGCLGFPDMGTETEAPALGTVLRIIEAAGCGEDLGPCLGAS